MFALNHVYKADPSLVTAVAFVGTEITPSLASVIRILELICISQCYRVACVHTCRPFDGIFVLS
jgi:hypothetical protein